MHEQNKNTRNNGLSFFDFDFFRVFRVFRGQKIFFTFKLALMGLDPASRINLRACQFWIPAFAGKTTFAYDVPKNQLPPNS